MTNELTYIDPRNLGIKKMHEIIYGIDWWEDARNKKTYLEEQRKLQESKHK